MAGSLSAQKTDENDQEVTKEDDSELIVMNYPGIEEVPWTTLMSSSSALDQTAKEADGEEEVMELVAAVPAVQEPPDKWGKYTFYRATESELHGIQWGGELFIRARVPYMNSPISIGSPIRLSGYAEQLRFVGVLLRRTEKSVEYLVWIPTKYRQANWSHANPGHAMRAIRGKQIDWEATELLLEQEDAVPVKKQSSIYAFLKKSIRDTGGVSPPGLKSQLDKLKLTLVATGEGKSPFLAPTSDIRERKGVDRLSLDDLPTRPTRNPRPQTVQPPTADSKHKQPYPKARTKKAEEAKRASLRDKWGKSEPFEQSSDWGSVVSNSPQTGDVYPIRGETASRSNRLHAQPKDIYYPQTPQIPSNPVPSVSSDALDSVRRSFEDSARELRVEMRRQHAELMDAVTAVQRTASAMTNEVKSAVTQEATTVLTHTLHSLEERLYEKMEFAIKDDSRVSMTALSQIMSWFGGPRVPFGNQNSG